MGRTWVGFQPTTKPVAGSTVVERDSFDAGIDDPALVRLLTTADGLAAWLAPTTAFTDRRGGNIDFTADDGTFTGTYSLIEIPRHITLITDRHGEIDVRIDVRARPTQVSVTITCVVPDGTDASSARQRARDVIAGLRGCIVHGRQAD